MPAARFLSRLPVVLLLGSSLTACFKKPDPITPTAPATYFMRWTVDGATISASTFSARDSGPGQLLLSGSVSGTGNALTLNIPTGASTFTLPDTVARVTRATYAVGSATYVGQPGTIRVTTYTPSPTAGGSLVGGTFSFLANATAPGDPARAITSGSFNLQY